MVQPVEVLLVVVVVVIDVAVIGVESDGSVSVQSRSGPVIEFNAGMGSTTPRRRWSGVDSRAASPREAPA